MKHILALLLALPSFVCAQDPAPAPPAPDQPAPAQTTAHSDPEAVLVTVNGTAIREKDAERRFQIQIQQQTGGMQIPEAQLAGIRDQLWPQVVSDLIDDTLLDQEVAAKEVSTSDAEAAAYLKRSLDAQLTMSGRTLEELSTILQDTQGIDLETFMKRQADDPDLRRTLSQVELVTVLFPDDVQVTDDEVKAAYDRDLEAQYTRGAEVHARHILIGTEGLTTDEERAEARTRAEHVLELARAEGADFEALAREHSTGPSAPMGGDLGFFPRQGAMVEPFAKAAFELPVGGISDLVETQFGFHIIQVIEKRDGSVISLEAATPWIRDELRFTKVGPLRAKLLEDLRSKATIVYPDTEAGE